MSTYQLIDSGNSRKLEQFGDYALIRPEPRAYWPPRLSESQWNQKAHAEFVPSSGQQPGKTRGGRWKQNQPLPESWFMEQPINRRTFQFRIAPTPFGHVGLFPEQADNWDFIAQQVARQKQPKVLNLFAYTGAASVVARAFGAEVYHVDASRPVLNWARENMEANGLTDIRWVYEDAFKFARREAKRGRIYSGIILDPPPAGRGRSGERWKLEDQLDDLLDCCAQILAPQQAFLLMSLYALNWAPDVGHSYVSGHLKGGKAQSGACLLEPAQGSPTLQQGTFVRYQR